MAESNLDWKKIFRKILLGDNDNSCDLEDHCVNKSADKITSETSEKFQNADCRRQLLKNSGDLNEKATENFSVNREVPEWNKVFKIILGDKERPQSCETNTTIAASVHCSLDSYMQIHSSRKTVQSDYASHRSKQIHNTQHPHRKPMNPHARYKSKKQSEEESYLEKVLALSQMFKPADMNYKLNDFDGSGVNVFKSGEPIGNKYSNNGSSTYENPHQISQTNKRIYFCPKDDYEDLCEQNAQNYKESTCSAGWVATKPYTYEDMISVKCVTDSEVWDEDLCI